MQLKGLLPVAIAKVMIVGISTLFPIKHGRWKSIDLQHLTKNQF